MKTIRIVMPSISDVKNSNYKYQPELTSKLDWLDSDFNQNIINEIILWKVNRYAEIASETLNFINKIKKSDKIIDLNLTNDILLKLLDKKQKGVRLAMASTILRFKNPSIYQIIDQRVYRFIYGEELKYSETDITQQIDIYLRYLTELRNVCNDYNIDFESADRILYSMDKEYNSDQNLNGY